MNQENNQLNNMHPDQLSGVGKNLLKLIEFDEDEILIDEIRKHPFGLFIIYMTGFAIGLSVLVVFFILPSLIKGDEFGIDISAYTPIFMFLGLIMFVLTFIGTMIGAHLYKNDVIVITNEKIAQVIYKTIFNRKISQLSIGDVQDVTVTQEGILPRIFRYGTIVIETAGEQANYKFTYVPDPYKHAKSIVGSHEVNLTKYGN
ncbi:PH domain-containing protein [Candidatus Saccharibacteria bacterium]|nr:PH domain-containing protein [Candidatus Saccharibacteria bacterium]